MGSLSSKALQAKTQKLPSQLEEALAAPTLSYGQVCDIDHQGLLPQHHIEIIDAKAIQHSVFLSKTYQNVHYRIYHQRRTIGYN